VIVIIDLLTVFRSSNVVVVLVTHDTDFHMHSWNVILVIVIISKYLCLHGRNGFIHLEEIITLTEVVFLTS
jgi:ABC-type Mn2+/Zn2+ transport system ATPase subunit